MRATVLAYKHMFYSFLQLNRLPFAWDLQLTDEKSSIVSHQLTASCLFLTFLVFLLPLFAPMLRSVTRASPVSINEAGVDVVRTLHPSDRLQADTGGLERHYVHQAVFELVARQVGTDES